MERIDGEIELNGNHYKYLKRKTYKDALILLCLPDDYKQKIETEKGDSFKWVNGIQQSSENNQEKANHSYFKTLSTAYQSQQTIGASA